MNSMIIESVPRAVGVRCTDEEIVVSLTDGRCLSVPVVWFPRLAQASSVQRDAFELVGDGEGIRWPQVDEDISVAGLLAGRPSREFGRSDNR